MRSACLLWPTRGPPGRLSCQFVRHARGGAGHDQFAFVDSFQALQAGRDLLQFAGRTTQDDHFHANVVAKVGVQGGDDQVRVVVLQLDQLVTKLRAMVVVDQREASGHFMDPQIPMPAA